MAGRWRRWVVFAALGVVIATVPGPAEGESTWVDINQRFQDAFDLAEREGVRSDRSAAREPRRVVNTPYSLTDPRGDAVPNRPRGDLTGYRAHNGTNIVELRFWLAREPATWNTADTFALLPIDATANGRGNDFDVVVISSEETGFLAGIGRPNFENPRCVSDNVTDLGPSMRGHGYQVRFAQACIGGPRRIRTRALFLYSRFDGDQNPTTDAAPNGRWTPPISPP
jgi:hypothetical protein